MSNRTMERICRANPFPNELPAPPIEEVWRRLDARHEPQPRRGSRSGGPLPAWLPGIGGVMTAISAIAAVAIAVLAIVLLGHNRSSTAPRPTSPAAARGTAVADCIAHGGLTRSYSVAQLRIAVATMPAHVKEYTDCYDVIQQALGAEIGGKPFTTTQLERIPQIRQLLDHFAVLRRPQTAADRSWAPGQRSNPKTLRQVIPSLTRLATTIDGKRIFLTVERVLLARPGHPARHGYFMVMQFVGPYGSSSGAPYDQNVGDYTITPLPFATGPTGPSPSISIVPDGITRVRWVLQCPRPGTSVIVGPPPGHAATCTGPRSETVYPALHDNIAAANVPNDMARAAATVTWYDATGKAVLVWSQSNRREQNLKPFPGVQP